jgi:transcriptional adapter 3
VETHYVTNVTFTTDMDHMLPDALSEAPDGDFPNSKPTDQIPIKTFNAHIEPYFRPLTEDDRAFLVGRGDNVTPYLILKLGKHYSKQWAEEGGGRVSFASPALPTTSSAVKHSNAHRGQPERLNDNMLDRVEATITPLQSRLCAAFMHEDPSEAGETSLSRQPTGTETSDTSLGVLAASHDTTQRLAAEWKVAMFKGAYHHLEQRLSREMARTGLMDPSLGDESEDTQDTRDDEITVRLRELQYELREQSIINGARKARIAERL